MFSREEDKDYLIQELIIWLGGVEKPREALTTPFFNTTFPAELRIGSVTEMIMDAVRLCVIDAWQHDPPWLVSLMRLLPTANTDAKLIEIRQRVSVKPPPAPDPLESTILYTGTPFVDRRELRLQLRRLATTAANAQPILVVSGEAKSGKSYSTKYIDYFSHNQPPIVPYPIEFDPDLGLEMGAVQVARDLVAMMGRPLDDMPEPTTNQKLHVQQLATWVLNEAAQSQSLRHWFILDNFKGDKLRQDTRELLVALSDRITKGVFPQRCRLILIGFDRALLTVDASKVDEELIGPCPPAEVERTIEEILTRAPVAVAPATVSAFVFDNLPNGEAKMKELDLRLRALLYAVGKVKDILASAPNVEYTTVLMRMLEDLPAGDDRMKELNKRLSELQSVMK